MASGWEPLRGKLPYPSLGALVLVLALTVLALLSSPFSGGSGLKVNAQEEHTYYGFVPREVWQIEPSASTVPSGVSHVEPLPSGQLEGGIITLQFNLSVENIPPRVKKVLGEYTEYQIRPGTEMTQASVVVVGNSDGTRVSAYSLPSKELLAAFTVNRLEQRTLSVANASFFKVVADRPVTVLFMGGIDYERRQAGFSGPFTSSEGGYVGREFILLAVVAQTSSWLNVRALEESELTLWDSNGSKVQEFKLSANQVKQLPLSPWAVYRLTSTGRVMLGEGGLYYPAASGGFVGKRFYTVGGGTESLSSYTVTGLQDTKIDAWDLGFRRKCGEAELAATSNATLEVKATHIAVESDTPVIVMPSTGSGVGYIGLSAGQSAYVYVPTEGTFGGYTWAGEAYIFAYKETTVTVDDAAIRLSADGILPLRGGFHKLSATENVLIEVVNWASGGITPTGITLSPKITRLGGFATVIPSVESLSITYQDLRLRPVFEEGLPWMVIAGAATVLAAGSAVYFLKIRKRS